MEQDENQADLQNTNSAFCEITKTYIFYTILAGILTMLPISTWILELIDLINPDSYISEYIYIISFYVVKVIGFLIYFFVLKKMTKRKVTLAIIAGIFLLFNGLMYSGMNSTENTGIDYIGQAIVVSTIFKICLYIYYIIAFILFILYAKKIIFKKKVIISIIISIILIILFVYAYKTISHYTSTQKVSEEIKSVNDFKNELVERNLYTEDNILFAVDNKEDNIHKINFSNNSEEKYPSYIYYGYRTKNETKNFNQNDDYLYWMIYYTNGKIYAALADYFESSYPNSYNIYSNILSEENEIYIYNINENYYEKINNENDGISTENLYYKDDNMYISIDLLNKSVFGYVEGLCEEYEVVDTIDADFLDNYANNIKSKNYHK